IPPDITGRMVDGVLAAQGNTQVLGFTLGLGQVVFLLLSVIFLQWLVAAFRSYLLRVVGDRMIVDMKNDIYAKAQFLPMSFYDKTSTGSVINRVNSDTANLQGFILRISQEAVTQGFLLIGLIIIMFVRSPLLSVVSLAPVPLVVFGSRIFGKKISPKYRRIWRRGSAISSLLADTIPGVRVIKAFTNEDSAIQKFKHYCEEWFHEDRGVAKISTAYSHVVGFLVACGTPIIWAVGGGRVQAGLLSAGLLVTFITYAGQFYGPVNFFATLNDSYQNTLASVEKILDILDAEPEHDFGKGDTLERLEGRIEFQAVNFSFDRSKKVLSNVNLLIEPGDTIGIVGTTGSGKSTLINLLMRYYDDYDGEIFIDGQNLKEIDMQYYRGQIGYVQQEPLMFKDSVFNNIAYGAGKVHVEQVLSAAEVANAHGFIARLPDAYDTMLGERGVGLSGGEKQRVSIARAVLKNPSILILDEATAAVDSETEHLIQQAIERLIRGRTTLMIAHRLSTLRKANKIIVVDKGEIIEFGSPQELMELKGKYYKLVQIQTMAEEAETQRKTENF
ncbi:MAG: ABC transporter ATP-binding protein/permease, partial [Oscillospiraceae bacterium]|nr:ABC transporter ATP-binding protein/permease [Oscillospiraceae bacterium]